MAVSIIPAGRLALIDAIRGFAALWVAVYHFYNSLGDSNAHIWREPLHSFCALGYLGVPIFFVLSGFVISNSLSGIDINTSVLGRFIGRRVFRLDPTYWFVIWLTVGVAVIKSWFSLGQNQSIPSFPSCGEHDVSK
jgi:peptidoglycan/LPS O-acetylase OafA/YrhL